MLLELFNKLLLLLLFSYILGGHMFNGRFLCRLAGMGPKILIVFKSILTSGNKIRTRAHAYVYYSAHDFMSILNSQFLLKTFLFTSHDYLFYFFNS